MAFIDRMIGVDEEIISRAHPHWIYLAQGVILMNIFIFIGYYLDANVSDFIQVEIDAKSESISLWVAYQMQNYMFLTFAIIGGFIFLLHLIYYRSTHLAITSDRLVFKTGMFFVDVHESALDEIKGEQVHNGFFGRFLDYGFIQVDCRFVENMQIPAIAKPYAFLHELHVISKKQKQESKKLNIDILDDLDELGL